MQISSRHGDTRVRGPCRGAQPHELDAEPALRFGDRELSYRELRDAAAAVAESLRGVSRAAVWAESTLETCVAVVGGLTAGVELVPLNPKLGTSELAHIIGDSQPEVVLGAPVGALDAADAPPPIAAVAASKRTRWRRCPPSRSGPSVPSTRPWTWKSGRACTSRSSPVHLSLIHI